MTRIVETADINFEQYNPNNLNDWGDYIEIGDELKLLEINMKNTDIPYLIEGDKGLGKTLMIHTLCRKLKIPLIEYSCSSETNKGDLIGRVQIDDQGSFFELGIIPTAFEVANHYKTAVLYMDELSSLSHSMMKLLNRPFDKRKSINANNKIYKLKRDCKLFIIGTMNPISYSGVNALTEDLRSRMIGMVMSYPTSKELEKIIDWSEINAETKDCILTLAQETHALRVKGDVDYVLSPRDIDQICVYFRMLSKEFELDKAIKLTLQQVVVSKYSEIEERELIKARIHEIFGMSIK